MISTLELKNIYKTFFQGDCVLEVLKGINVTIFPGEMVALLGQSGAGKSTLLQISGLLDTPSEGHIFVGGTSCQGLKDYDRTQLRRQYIGFVYQFHHLLPEFSALENVMIPQLISGRSKAFARERAMELLQQLNLSRRFHHRPRKLSGGEQQRVAIARALANNPKLLLTDEPTGNLDNQTAEVVFQELLEMVKETGLSVLIATHNLELAKKMDRIMVIKDGKIQ